MASPRSCTSRTAWLLGALPLAYVAAVALVAAVAEFVPLGNEWRVAAYALGRPSTTLLVTAILIAAALIVERTADPRTLPLFRWMTRCPAWMFAAAYSVALSVVSIRKHFWLESYGCDLGIFENVLWNTTQGHVLYSSILGRHFLGEHVSPILLLLAPVYVLWQDPRLLLIVQSLALGLAVLPIYWLAERRLGRPAAVVFAVAYLVYKPLLRVNLFDFHEIALAVPLLAFAFYFLETGRRGPFFVMLGLAVACKEEVSLIATTFGIYLMVKGDRRQGFLLMLGGLCIFLLHVGVVLPWYRGSAFPYVDRYSHLGDSLPGIVETIVRRPAFVLAATLTREKIAYLIAVFGPLAFLPLLGWRPLMLAVPTLARNLLSNQPAQYSLDLHFLAPAIPFVFFAGLDGFDRASRFIPRLVPAGWRGYGVPVPGGLALALGSPRFSLADPRHATGALGLAVVIAGMGLGLTPLRALRDLPHDDGPARLRRLLEMVPPGASLAAHNSIVPHAARRSRITVYPHLDGAQYVLLRFRSVTEYPLPADEDRRQLAALVTSGEYAPVAALGGLVLLERGRALSSADLAEALKAAMLVREVEHLQRTTGGTVVDPEASGGAAIRIPGQSGRRRAPVFSTQAFMPPGAYRLVYDLSVEEGRGDTEVEVEIVSAHTAKGGTLPIGRARAAAGARGYQRIAVTFDLARYGHVDATIRVTGEATLRLDRLEIEPLFPLDQFAARLAAYGPGSPRDDPP